MRNKTLAAIFAAFLGSFGVHRFYLGQVGLGIFYAIFFWTGISAILGIIDALVFFGMSQEEFDYRYNKSKVQFQQPSRGSRPQGRVNVPPASKDSSQPWGTPERRSQTTITPTRRAGQKTAPTTRNNNNEFKKSGIKKFKEFDYAGAIEDFNKSLESNPRDIATHFNLACAFSLTEDKSKAYYHLQQAVVLGFNDFEKIHTHESLAFVRIQPEYMAFKESKYTILPEWKESDEEHEEEQTTSHSTSSGPALNPAPNNDLLEEIRRLETLKELGVLNDQEFIEQKQKLENLR